VMVLLGILGGVLAPVIVQLVENHQFTRLQADLTARGRLALERVVREIRHAVPGTVRDTGIEFLRAQRRFPTVPTDGFLSSLRHAPRCTHSCRRVSRSMPASGW
ncbi:MAG: hypothetical protein WC012_04285, partial [Thiohalomonadaceae bacterium]